MTTEMNVLVYERDDATRSSLCYLLVSLGIRGIPAATLAEARETVASDTSMAGAIVDTDQDHSDGMELIRFLRDHPAHGKTPIIAHSSATNRSFVGAMARFGNVRYLSKPFQEEMTKRRLEAIFSGIGQAFREKREHIRVRPDPEELLRASVRLEEQERIFGVRVLDLSLGGAAIELLTPASIDEFTSGQRVADFAASVLGRDFHATGTILKRQDRLLVVRFNELSDQDTVALSRYIFSRMSPTNASDGA
jgi:DNA-binding response OmpR family regulator